MDPFSYQICDSGTPSLCDTAVVNLTVSSMNDKPVAVNDTTSTPEDMAVTTDLAANDTDIDGNLDPTSVALIGTLPPASQGTIVNNGDGTITFTPAPNFNGAVDPFDYQICDSGTPSLCDTATVYITVDPVNDKPVAVDDTDTTPEDTPITTDLAANDTDVDGNLDPTSLTLIGPLPPASQGTIVNNGDGTITFTPATNYVGPVDPFEYRICDTGSPVLCDTATVMLTVSPANDPPMISQPPVLVPEDSFITFCPTVSDPDLGDMLTVSLCSTPSNGTATSNDTCITYTPDPNFNGPDSVCVMVCDQNGLCDSVMVPITVDPVNDPPVAVDDTDTTPENTAVTTTVLANDSDPSDPLGNIDPSTVGIISTPANGTVTINPGGTITYTPNANFSGTDSYEYVVCDDGHPLPSLCDTGLVTITVVAANDPPVAVNDTVSTDEDMPLVVDVLGNDSDPDGAIDAGSVSIINGPSHGTTSVDPTTGEVTYSPDANYHGPDSFEYVVCDNGMPVLCDSATVVLSVDPVNDAPVAMDDQMNTTENTPVSVSVTNNDTDPSDPLGNIDPTSVMVVGPPSNGSTSVDPTTGVVTYTPNTGFNGLDTLYYQVCDDGYPLPAACDTAMVVVSVGSVNDPPMAVDDYFTIPEDANTHNFNVLLNDIDPDGVLVPSSVSIVSGPSNGTASVDPILGLVSYKPDPNFSGVDTLEYQVCDNGVPAPVLCDQAYVIITVSPSDDPPVAVDDAATGPEDQPLVVDVVANDIDPDGNLDPTSVTIISGPSNGSVTVHPITGEVTYTPNPNFVGNDTLTYEICDTSVPPFCDQAMVVLTLTDQNDPPLAVDDPVVTDEDMPITVDVLSNDLDPDGNLDPSSVTISDPPTNGTTSIDPVTGEITYTPAPNFNGLDTLSYQVCDAGTPSLCDEAEVIITVNPVNDAPIGVDDYATTASNMPVSTHVINNDIDIDGNINPATLFVFSPPANGTAKVNTTTGEITYTPNAGFIGTDSLVYFVCDDGTPQPPKCTTASLIITVGAAVNQPPVANDDSRNVPEDQAVGIPVVFNDTDPDGVIDPTTVTIVTPPANGSVSVNPTTGDVVYTPNPNFNGTDSFTYSVCDNGSPVLCDTATVTLNLYPVNDAPIAVDDHPVTDEDMAVVIDVTANDTDIDGNIDPTSVSVITGPTNGTLSINPTTGEVTYTPDPNYNGTDSFDYVVCDDGTPLPSLCDTATVRITVDPVNDKPVAVDDQTTTDEDMAVVIDVLSNDSDLDGTLDPSSVVVITGPSNGTVSINPTTGEVTYSPNPDYNGPDSFDYVVCDNGMPVLCDTATVTITVDPINDNPVAVDDPTTTDEDMPVVIDVTANDTDIDGNIDPTSVSIVSGPTNGTVKVDPITGEVTYTPNPNFNGMDTLVYQVCDDGTPLPVACSQAMVILTVDPVEDPPVAVDDVVSTNEDIALVIDVPANDIDPDGNLDLGSVTIVTGPSNGTVAVDPVTGEVTYTPNTGFNGSDSFEYSICDSGMPASCDTALVTITVHPVNDAPIAIDDPVTTDEDVDIVVDVLNNDSDPDGTLDPSSVRVINGPSNGTISINPTTGEITYSPNPNFHGPDSFDYVVCDNGMPILCDTATVSITVDPVNDAPMAVDDPVTTDEDNPITVDVLNNDSDPDGTLDPSSVSVQNGPSNGTISIDPTTGEITYSPNPNFNGTDSFSYQVCDNGSPALCDTATVTITVDPVNDAPIAIDDVATTDEDMAVAVDVLVNDTDPDGALDPSSVQVITGPSNGTVNVNPTTGVVTYTPDPNFHGTDSFDYVVCDVLVPSQNGMGVMCDTATVTITVNPVNDGPIAVNDVVNTDEDIAIVVDVLANDSDPDGVLDPSSVMVTVGPLNGTVSVNPTTGEVTYTPNPNFHGTDSFGYVVCDNGTPPLCDNAMVMITVDPVNDGPIVQDDPVTTPGGQSVTVDVLSNDSDPDGTLDTGSVTILSGPSNGTATVDPTTGEVTYTPNTGFTGPDTLVYQVCDSEIPPLCGQGMVIITVQGGCISECEVLPYLPQAFAFIFTKGTFPGAGGMYIFDQNGGKLTTYTNGTANISGTLINQALPSIMWEVDFWLENRRDWGQWSGLNRQAKGGQNGPYQTWEYYEVDSTRSKAVGQGLVAGDTLFFRHDPPNYLFGFQIGQGANDKDGDYGASGWFRFTSASGNYTGHGDFNVDLDNCQACGPVPPQAPLMTAVAVLQGAYEPTTGVMATQLNAQGMIPLTQPYNTAPWFYQGTENVSAIPNDSIVDWVLIETRDAAQPTVTLSQQAAFINEDGEVVGLNGSALLQPNIPQTVDSFYITINHRNHLGVMTADPIKRKGNVFFHNFSKNLQKIYLNPAIPNPSANELTAGGLIVLFEGDQSSDDQVNSIDLGQVMNQTFMTGYRTADINLNGLVNSLDVGRAMKNYFKRTHIPK